MLVRNRAYIVWERIIAGIYLHRTNDSIGKVLISLCTNNFNRICNRSDLVLFTTQLGWQAQSSIIPDKWLDGLHRDLILSTACHHNLGDCVHNVLKLLFDQWFNQPSNNSIEPNHRPVVYCTECTPRQSSSVSISSAVNINHRAIHKKKPRIQSGIGMYT